MIPTRELPGRLRALADTLDCCEWEHPLRSAETCREAAEVLDKAIAFLDVLLTARGGA